MKKKIVKISLLILIIVILFLVYLKNTKEEKKIKIQSVPSSEPTYSSNIIKDVHYTSKDAKGNKYIIKALEGEIDFNKSNIIYLSDVKAIIELTSSENIIITSDFGKYNTNNFDTIFSKNVIVEYLENNIFSEYLDFSTQRNSMIISRNVVYTNLENILKADVVEIDIKTKDTKIFMYEEEEKVNIQSIN